MNDDFLQQMRTAPRPEFLAELKRKLDRQPVLTRPRRSYSFIRGLITGLLLAGAGLAIAAATIDGMPAALRALVRTPVQFLARVLPGGHGSEQGNSRDHHGVVPLGPAWAPTHPGGQSGTGSGVDAVPAALEAKTRSAAGTSSARAQDSRAEGAAFSWSGSESITVAASPTAFVIAQLAANRYKTPNGRAHVELTGGPILRLCHTQPYGPPEIIEVSQRISARELSTCGNYALRDILEVKLAYQAIVLVRSKLYGPLKLSARDLFLALARKLPDPSQPERLIENPNVTWNQVNPALPYDRIELIGPVVASPPGRLTIELLMDAGCNSYPRMALMREQEPARYEEVCRSIREDGVYRESPVAGGYLSPFFTDQLVTNPTAVGILPFEQLEEVRDKLAAIAIDGVDATAADIANTTYPLSRGLYIYAIKRQVFASSAFSAIVRYNMMSGGWGFLQLDRVERAATLANLDTLKNFPN